MRFAPLNVFSVNLGTSCRGPWALSGDGHQFDRDVVWSFGRGGRSAFVLSHYWLLFLPGLHGVPAWVCCIDFSPGPCALMVVMPRQIWTPEIWVTFSASPTPKCWIGLGIPMEGWFKAESLRYGEKSSLLMVSSSEFF